MNEKRLMELVEKMDRLPKSERNFDSMFIKNWCFIRNVLFEIQNQNINSLVWQIDRLLQAENLLDDLDKSDLKDVLRYAIYDAVTV